MPERAPDDSTASVCRVIGTGDSEVWNRHLGGETGQAGAAQDERDIADERAGKQVGEDDAR